MGLFYYNYPMHIIKKIRNITQKAPTLFATPGHMQGFYTMREFGELFGEDVFSSDFAEIQSMDNLQNPQDAIRKSLDRAAGIYGTKSTFYLVNGSSSGIIALMLAAVKQGEKVLIARNAHKSVINALILSGAEPVWAETEWNCEWNIPGPVSPSIIAKKLDEYSDIKTVWITSPTYEGIASDITSISALCNQRNLPLIVDEAHGALWPFNSMLPDSAIYCGADACVQSLHKTGSCLNQGAVLHLSKTSKISSEKIQQVLNIINTTSPSYILLSSIEASIEYLSSRKGKKRLNSLVNNINSMKIRLKTTTDSVFLENADPTKIFFGIKNVSGNKISDYLEDKLNIEVELNNEKGLLALTGIGTTEKSLKKLEKAIEKACKTLPKTEQKMGINPYIIPEIKLTPREAFYSESKCVELIKAIGLISRETIVKYPPGVPLIIAGEVIQEGHLEFLADRKKIEIVQ